MVMVMLRKTLSISLLLSMSFAAAHAAPNAPYVIARNTLRFLASATRAGDVDPSMTMDVTLWLKPHNRSELDAMAKAVYDPSSPLYHQWMDRGAFAAAFAPTADESQRVQAFLTAHNLTVLMTDPDHFFVRARGTAADVQKAFNVELANFAFRGQVYRANTSDPSIDDDAGSLVGAIEGLDSLKMTHPLIAQAAAAARPAGKSAEAAGRHAMGAKDFPSACFTKTTTESFSSPGGLPTATIQGNLYNFGADGCGYTPPEIQAAYGLTSLYAAGYDGKGQTIVIVDWCGSPTVESDANNFSAKYGLPALTSANFRTVYFPGQSTCAAEDSEINLDVEWSHAIAPGAKIALVVPPSASFPDIDSALIYIVEAGLGNVVSNSYGSEESETSLATLDVENQVIEAAALTGISMNFSSGDDGDFTFGDPQFLPPSVSAPADSPYATAVGGISLALNADNVIQWQAGWGTNETLIVDGGVIFDPAYNFGFNFGSGGGVSAVFTKPSFQAALKGRMRHVPDISWLADPFTGAVIAITEQGVAPSPTYTVYGGTSLACPMFSALWAIADQAAGHSLGLAAAALYSAPPGVISDIVPVSSPTNVTAVIKSAGQPATYENANALAAPLEKSKVFLSAMWNSPLLEQDTVYVLTFGTDSGLVTAPGWDNVTGLGVPNPAALVANFAAH
jgi:subtilase family serine protease